MSRSFDSSNSSQFKGKRHVPAGAPNATHFWKPVGRFTALLSLMALAFVTDLGRTELTIGSRASAEQSSVASVQGLFRETKEFDTKLVQQLLSARLAHEQSLEPSAPGSSKAESLMRSFIDSLAKNIGLEAHLENPPLKVVLVRGYLARPFAEMKLGVLQINRMMIDILESDDELAAVLGHETLHLTLKHDLLGLRLENSLVYSSLLKFAGQRQADPFGSDSASGGLKESAAGIAADWKARTVKDHEDEVDRKLPRLLAVNGYDAWAIVDVNARILDVLKDAPPAVFDRYARNLLSERTEAIEQVLIMRGVQRKPTRSTQVIDQLKALLK